MDASALPPSALPAGAPARGDDRGVARLVNSDLPCHKCGYNLRGLALDGRCPECGTPVGTSARGELLRYADPAWVAKLVRGLRLILWGVLAAIVAAAGGTCVFGETLLAEIVGFAGGLVNVYGAWLLTEPNPGSFGEDHTVTARKIVR